MIMLRTTNYILKSVSNPMKYFVRFRYPDAFTFHLNNLPAFEVSHLENGLTVMTEQRRTPHVCIGLFVNAGSRYECNYENGITHFFEHICFKGTNARERALLEEQMTNTGALFDCETSRELACYRVRCLASQAALCFDLLTDCVLNNAYNEAEITRQRTVVAAEMNRHDTDPNALLDDYLHAAAFQGTPMAQTVMGISTNLCNYNSATISTYMNKFFDSCRTAVVVIGGIKHDEVMCLARTYMSKLEPTKCLDKDLYRFTASEIRFRDDSLPQALVMLAVEAPGLNHEDAYVMEVTKEVLGGWDVTQGGGMDHAWELARAGYVGELASAFKAFYYPYKDSGLFGVKFMSGRMELADMTMMVQREFNYIIHKLTDKEVSRAKRVLKCKLLSRNMDMGRMCLEAGRDVVWGGAREPLADRVARVDAVSTAQVRAAASRYIETRSPVVVAVGPTEAMDDYTRLCSNMYWLRA